MFYLARSVFHLAGNPIFLLEITAIIIDQDLSRCAKIQGQAESQHVDTPNFLERWAGPPRDPIYGLLLVRGPSLGPSGRGGEGLGSGWQIIPATTPGTPCGPS